MVIIGNIKVEISHTMLLLLFSKCFFTNNLKSDENEKQCIIEKPVHYLQPF